MSPAANPAGASTTIPITVFIINIATTAANPATPSPPTKPIAAPTANNNGKFPNIHIGGSKAMKDRGVSCATSQDAEAQKNNLRKIDVSKIINEIDK